MFSVFPLRPDYQREHQQDSLINKLAKNIVDIALLPIKLFAFFIMLPVLIPLAIMHSIIAISVNIFIFSFLSISSLLLLTACEIAFPLGIISILLISSLALSYINNQLNEDIKNLFGIFTIL
jgi:hypothetical protein